MGITNIHQNLTCLNWDLFRSNASIVNQSGILNNIDWTQMPSKEAYLPKCALTFVHEATILDSAYLPYWMGAGLIIGGTTLVAYRIFRQATPELSKVNAVIASKVDALHQAIQEGDFDKVNNLTNIKNRADSPMYAEFLALHQVIQDRDFDKINNLITIINRADSLMYVENINSLFDYEVKNKDTTSIMLACSLGHWKIAKWLIFIHLTFSVGDLRKNWLTKQEKATDHTALHKMMIKLQSIPEEQAAQQEFEIFAILASLSVCYTDIKTHLATISDKIGATPISLSLTDSVKSKLPNITFYLEFMFTNSLKFSLQD